MSFRRINEKYLEPAAQGMMLFGIVALCQPWSLFLHRYGVTITLVGLVGFMIATKIPRHEEAEPGERHARGAGH
jgi:hypothetical protein